MAIYWTPEHWPGLTKDIKMIESESTEDKEIGLPVIAIPVQPVIDLSLFSSFTKLKRVTAWILRFLNNCLNRTHV